ncbi:hypothetical protein Plhal703r1_c61g0165621 [Plasmopara halstedii]
MTREVWFQLVDREGEALTSANFAELKESYLAGIAASDLTVYANTNGAKQKLSKLSTALSRFAAPAAAEAHPGDPQVDWTVIPCARLVVDDADSLIELSATCIHGTGIGRPGQSPTLYRRPALVKQWNEMKRCSIQTYAILWVVGPPETSKSCTALAFACALDRSHWEVPWIHYSRTDKLFNCVWLHENEKTFCVIKEETIERDLPAVLNGTTQTQPTTVFLDGLVCACSMVILGKKFRASDYPPIPTHVNIGNHHCSFISPSADVDMEQRAGNDDVEMKANEDDEDVDTEMMFKLDSWRFEEYANAISKFAFYNRVVNMFHCPVEGLQVG